MRLFMSMIEAQFPRILKMSSFINQAPDSGTRQLSLLFPQARDEVSQSTQHDAASNGPRAGGQLQTGADVHESEPRVRECVCTCACARACMQA